MVDPKRVWYILSQIPEGKIITYGQLAEMADAPKAARTVGNILKQLPAGTGLPWHRVVNHKGKISFPKNTPRHQKQKMRLEKEGIILVSEKINLKTYCWNGE
ncbi:MAG: methylated-DNA--[protein]-cysteine S-methyltransferase [Candidatus Endonucleobacter bathymodioli]|uniref:Methylated-DNA--[protein]-cysteine S-methyltransferase n=1 Tax=Candidatus Endonucleibacter bathymodioli TaxID=539814 RepID=A0AA90P1K5_9GAMM|nr:methylated-DNA--[protein]-cysteine S-methyltransferase [Candidatus Endonucleobacter bathymodioli]